MKQRLALGGGVLVFVVFAVAALVTAPDVGAGTWIDYTVLPLALVMMALLARGPAATEGWVQLAARLTVGGVWIWAGVLKLPDPSASIESVRAYELLPAQLVEPVGYLLPPLEVVVGLALVMGVMTRGAAVLSGLLLLAFIYGISWAWSQGLKIDCGCFGTGGANPNAELQYPWEIARDVALLVLTFFVFTLRERRLALDSVLFRTAPLSPELLAALDDDLDADASLQPKGTSR